MIPQRTTNPMEFQSKPPHARCELAILNKKVFHNTQTRRISALKQQGGINLRKKLIVHEEREITPTRSRECKQPLTNRQKSSIYQFHKLESDEFCPVLPDWMPCLFCQFFSHS